MFIMHFFFLVVVPAWPSFALSDDSLGFLFLRLVGCRRLGQGR